MNQLRDMIKTLTGAGLRVEFSGFEDSEDVYARIFAPELEHPRGGAIHVDPGVALALAASRGLASIYNRVRAGFLSLEEEHDPKHD